MPHAGLKFLTWKLSRHSGGSRRERRRMVLLSALVIGVFVMLYLLSYRANF